MSYGEYQYFLSKPQTLERTEWETYIDRKKEMESWISEQKWDHWGTVHGGKEGFWFMIEENYKAFKKHFGVDE
jgi:hypothetical protein